MVASTIRLPNIRRMIVPDRGHVLVDADLSGADAQVVAWEAGDESLKTAFREGLKIHIFNARSVWPDETANMTDGEIKATGSNGGIYYQIKRAVHGTNYGASYNAIMAAVGWKRRQAEEFIERWFYLHPEIKEWHERYERYLNGTQCWNCSEMVEELGKPICQHCGVILGRTVKNAFGFRRTYFDRLDQTVRNQALAWTPQSTVAFCTELGWTTIAESPEITMLTGLGETQTYDLRKYLVDPNSYSKWHNVITFLIQVHDSIVFQVPFEYEKDIPEIVNSMRVVVPYADPLIIPMEYKSSRVSWGDCG